MGLHVFYHHVSRLPVNLDRLAVLQSAKLVPPKPLAVEKRQLAQPPHASTSIRRLIFIVLYALLALWTVVGPLKVGSRL